MLLRCDFGANHRKTDHRIYADTRRHRREATSIWLANEERSLRSGAKAYRLVVSDSEDNLNRGNYVYDSGKTNSGLSVGIKYAGAALKPATRYYWRVTVTDEKEKGNRFARVMV